MADTEERNLPPTATKLRRARRDGKVAHSRDVVTLALLPVLIWLYFNWGGTTTDLKTIMVAVFTQDFTHDAAYLTGVVAPAIFRRMIDLAAPLLAMAAAFGVLMSIVDTQGVVFSTKPVAPDFTRVNPGGGLKRIFSARTAAEAGFSLIKLSLFAGIAGFILWGATGSLRRLQVCGLPCVPDVAAVTLLPLLIAAVGLFLAAAVIDFVLSRSLFRMEMRMSFTELKHENRDSYGNPEQKRHRRDEGRRNMSGPTRLGIAMATLVVEGRDGAVGLRYVPAEIKAPVVVSKGYGPIASGQIMEAAAARIPIVRNDELAAALLARGSIGALIPAATFTDVANEIVKAERR